MAIKKNELYSSLWASCDKLRGGMDASQYKDYILTLLFVKYVTDKFKGVKYADITVPEGGSFDDLVAIKNDPNIGEKMDKVIAKLAEAGNNNLTGVITNAHFNDESKLGKGQEMVDKLTGLIGIFQRDEFDFTKNKAAGDDILGDAYEYLMRNFATESGKSKGQFYTPAEVSRILAKVIGIDKVDDPDTSVYDPACGSGSLLIRAADEAPIEVAIYGQEKEITTAGLAKMNLVLHNKATGEIYAGNTFSDPHYKDDKDDSVLRRFDFAVANPPFSLKNWTDGLKDYGRFTGYGDTPPEKNGDFAWLMHILKSLKSTGKAAVILPHGVLFRGNAEATIRKSIIDKGYIKGIIGLPANLFYGTGIPACIIVIDKSDADERTGIFMIDASHDYVKDGNKNRLREQDIYKIVTTFNEQITTDPKYARFVPNDEIKIKNDYNLNIPRYIDSSTPEDLQDIEAHLHGGIPAVDVDSMERYWTLFPKLKDKLFSPLRDGYYKLNIDKDDVRSTVYADEEFSAYAERIDMAFDAWMKDVDDGLRNIDEAVEIKKYIVELSEILIAKYADIELVDKYDVYQVLLSYWQEVMADDVFVLVQDGYKAGRETEEIYEISEDKKTKKEKKKYKGWEGKLIPKTLIEAEFFAAERAKIDEAQAVCDETQGKLDELVEEHTADGGVLADYLNDKDAVDAKAVNAKIKELKKTDPKSEELAILCEYAALSTKVKEYTKLIKDLNVALDEACKAKYAELTIEEIKELLINRKWYYTIFEGIKALYVTTSHEIANRILELSNRYRYTLEEIEIKYEHYHSKVKKHLQTLAQLKSTSQAETVNNLITGQIRLPGFAGQVKYKPLKTLCTIFNDGDWIESKDQSIDGIRLIQTGNIGRGRYLDKEDKQRFISEDTFNRLNCFEIFENDVLVSRLPEPAGRACILPHSSKRRITAVDCTIIRFADYSPILFVAYTQTQEYQEKVDMAMAGSTRQRISRKELGEILIPVFPTKEEQETIASILSDIDNEIEIFEQKLDKTRQIKQGMMQQLLTRKIRLV